MASCRPPCSSKAIAADVDDDAVAVGDCGGVAAADVVVDGDAAAAAAAAAAGVGGPTSR